MKIAVFGATGRTGARLVRQAIARGHEVTAVARREAGIERHENLRTAVGDAGDVESLVRAFEGADAIAFALGHSKTSGPQVLGTGIRSVIAAMERTGVRRLVAISASGHTSQGDALFTRAVVKPLLGSFLKEQYADMRDMEEVILASGTEWTILRPPMLLEKPGTGSYRSRVTLNVRGSFTISRDDLATAMLDLLESPDAVRSIVSVAG